MGLGRASYKKSWSITRGLALAGLLLLLSCTEQYSPIEWHGHRGARGLFPENSILAFEKAQELKMDYLELDVVITRDSMITVSHEPFINTEICRHIHSVSLPRDTFINIYKVNYSDLSSFDCGSLGNSNFPNQQKLAQQKPSLELLVNHLDSISRSANTPLVKFNLELKSRPEWDKFLHPEINEYVQLLYSTLLNLDLLDRIIFQSFDRRALEIMYDLEPSIPLCFLTEESESAERQIKELAFQIQYYSPNFKLLKIEDVNFCESQQIEVVPWTVNSTKDYQSLIEMGVSGIITDYPDSVVDFLEEYY